MSKPIGIDEAWLREKYLVEKISASKIAEECNCSVPTVITYLKKYAIKNRGWSEAKIAQFSHDTSKAYRDPNWLFDQYVNNKRSSGDIAKLCGCGRTTIRTYLNRFNVPIRSHKEISNSKEFKEKIGRITKGRWEDPVECNKFLEPIRSPEHRAKLSQRAKQLWSNPEYASKMPQCRGDGEAHPYCHKFNHKLKTKIRKSFYWKCILCGKEQYEPTLNIHHIDYNKVQGCKGVRWSLVPLCMSCHRRTNFYRWKWFNCLINYWAIDPEINLSLTGWETYQYHRKR